MRLALAFADDQSPKLLTRDQARLARARSFSEVLDPDQCFKTIIAFVTHPEVTNVIATKTFRVLRRHQ